MNALVTKARAPGRIKSSILKWLGVPVTLYGEPSVSFWKHWFGASSNTGECVTEDKALQLSTVWACVRLISSSIAMLPLKLYQQVDDERSKLAKRHPLYRILTRAPNADMTAMSFWQAFIACILLQGFGAAWIRRIDERIVALDLLLPARLTRRRLPSGVIETKYKGLDGKERTIPEDDLLWVPFFTLDGVTPLTPIQYAVNVLGNAIAADRVAGKTFKHGLLSPIFFTIARVLKPEQREQFRESLDAITGAMNSGKSPVLEGGMDAKAIGINPNDAQLLESRSFSVEEICRWYGVPPDMVGHLEKQTSFGTGVEQRQIGFLTFCLQPIVETIEQGVERACLKEGEKDTYFAKFTLEALMRADMKTRAAFFSTMTQNGIMTRDECRVKENLPPMGGNAKVLTVQVNMSPLDKLGEQVAPADSAIDALKRALGLETKDEVEEADA